MAIDLYFLAASPPCRLVQLVAKALGIDLNLIVVDLAKGDHLKPEFLKINPQHTIPTLNDNGLILTESRAIAIYLLEKYGNNSQLYPNDVNKRAVINQKLYFDIGTLFQAFANYFYPYVFFGQSPNPDNYKKIEAALTIFNTFLETQKFAAGDTYTVADIALFTTVSSFVHASGFSLGNSYPNVTRWIKDSKPLTAGLDLNEIGVVELAKEFAVANKKLNK